MSEAQTFRLVHATARRMAGEAVARAPEGFVCVVRPPNRSLIQNRRLHAAITDIAEQLPWPPETGEIHDVEWWKRRLTLQWLTETGEQPDLIVSLDGLQFALLLPHTSDLNTKQCAALNEWISIFGAKHGVTFGKDEV